MKKILSWLYYRFILIPIIIILGCYDKVDDDAY